MFTHERGSASTPATRRSRAAAQVEACLGFPARYVYGNGRFASPTGTVVPAVHTDHDFLRADARLTPNAQATIAGASRSRLVTQCPSDDPGDVVGGVLRTAGGLHDMTEDRPDEDIDCRGELALSER